MNKVVSKKENNIKIGSIQKQYGVLFDNANPNMKLGTYLERRGFSSLSKALNRIEKNSQNK